MSMIEQVARGMRLRDFCRAAKLDARDPEALAFDAAWASAGSFIQDQWFTLARAALEAMHEPDEATIEAGIPAFYEQALKSDADCVRFIWTAMIDAALNSGKQSA